MEYNSFYIILISVVILLCDARTREKRTDIEFLSDTDVRNYLHDREKQMDIFKCKKIVMVQWLHSVIPYVDLECQVLGEVKSVRWSVNDTLLDTVNSERYISLSQPHYSKRVFFNKWKDYKLRMLQVTEKDNGPYSLAIEGPDGHTEHRDLMLEVMTDYREDKWVKWMQNVDKDRNKFKSSKRSSKLRRRALMRTLRKRAKQRKSMSRIDPSLIFDQ